MDFTRKIREILEKTDCKRHKVPEGIPCFHLRMDSHEGYYAAICNTRATKIYNGAPAESRLPFRRNPNRDSKKENR